MIDRAVGLVYAPGLEGLVRSGLVDVLEVEPEMFWCERAGTLSLHREAWDHVRGLPLPKLVHGVGWAVGGTLATPADDARLFRQCADALDARWASHHLAFNMFARAGGTASSGFFLPPRQTDDGVARAIASIGAIAHELACPFAIETGVSYLRPRADELPDGDFVARVARGADCAILLDLHNVWTNQQNGRQPVDLFLAALPLDRVIEVHVAGGFALDGFWLDAHSGRPPDEVLDLLDHILPHLPAARAVCFEVLTPFVPAVGVDVVAGVLERIRRAWDRPRKTIVPATPATRAITPGPSAAAWETALGSLAIGTPPTTPLEHELATDPAIALLARLIKQARAGMLTDALPITTRLLLVMHGPEQVIALFDEFWRAHAPSRFASTEADAFAAWMAHDRTLADALGLDLASGRAEATGEPQVVSLSIDPNELCAALGRGVLPPPGGQAVVATVTPRRRATASS